MSESPCQRTPPELELAASDSDTSEATANGNGVDETDQQETPTHIELDADSAQALVMDLVAKGLVSWSEVASKILQSLQPPQTATHVPQLNGFRARLPAGKRWPPARLWMYAMYGPCPFCGSTMDLTHDHVLPRELLHDEADVLENLRFLCYRCNQSRHWEKGGVLKLGTAAAAMYLLVKHQPTTLKELTRLGRSLGLSQSVQRFEESWAFAIHQHREGRYLIEEPFPTVSEEELAKLRAYYLEANELFARFEAELRGFVADETKRRWDSIRLLVSTRNVSPEDRLRAAESLGLDVDAALREVLSKKKLTDQARRSVLEAVGLFSHEDIDGILASKTKLVSLWHLLPGDERERIRATLEQRVQALRVKHGVLQAAHAAG